MSGGYGKGDRFPIAVSRGILSAIQSGALAQQKVIKHPKFGFEVPTSCPGLDSKFLDVSDTSASDGLVQKFKKNFETFASQMDNRVRDLGGPGV